jgi:radical SAM superfamily enzyme YgiQ (UPF0313 family)
MKIAFVWAPFNHKRFEEDIEIVSEEFTVPTPLGLAYAAAIAEEHGHECIIIDANVNPRLTKNEVLAKIIDFKPDLLGFLLTIYMFRQTHEWVRFMKKNTGLPILAGNICLDYYAKEVFFHPEYDYGIIGPATKNLPELLQRLENKKSVNDIEGLVFRKDNQVRINFPKSLKEDFGILPFPALHLLDNRKYNTIISKRKNFTVMMTSKGCPFKCNFCIVHNLPYSCRTPENAVDEIERAYREFNIREIEFFDPIFNFNKKRVIDICREIVRRGLDVHWACRARIDLMDEELLKWMKEAGCHRIYYGVESGSNKILEDMNKGITTDKTREILKLTKKQGIMTLAFILFGAKGDTYETVTETIDYVCSLPLDYAQFHRCVAKPATPLYDQIKQTTGRDYWAEYILGIADEERLPTPWTSLSDEEIEELTVKAYRTFYFKPKRLWKLLIGIKSFEEFTRYVRSAIGLLKVKSDLS